MAGSTLLFSEVLDRVHKAKTKDQKVKILRANNTPALRSVLKSSFDPNIAWVLPEGEVPFTKNDAPIGTEHTTLATESRKLYHFIKGAIVITNKKYIVIITALIIFVSFSSVINYFRTFKEVYK